MTQAFFITGTNTDIGKTFITAGLAQVSLNLGKKTAVMKPIQTGTADYEPDLSIIRSIAPGIEELDQALSMPYAYPIAASPHLASAEQGEVIDPANVLDAFTTICQGGSDTLLVEGAGGIFVPIAGEYTMLNLMQQLAIPVILVGTVELGAINHALLSVEALKNAGVPIAGIILNKVPQNPSLIEGDNVETIRKLSKVPLLATVEDISNAENLADELCAQLSTQAVAGLFN